MWRSHEDQLDYHHMNLSYDKAYTENLVRGKGKPISLQPRMPIDPRLVNDKSKNKRTPDKVKPTTLGLSLSVDQDKFKEKKGRPQPKAYHGATRKQLDPREVYTHPQTLGTPIEPIR